MAFVGIVVAVDMDEMAGSPRILGYWRKGQRARTGKIELAALEEQSQSAQRHRIKSWSRPGSVVAGSTVVEAAGAGSDQSTVVAALVCRHYPLQWSRIKIIYLSIKNKQ